MLFKKLIDVLTLGSEHPVKRLIAYYTVLVAVMVLLATFFPTVDRLLGGQGPSGQVMAGELLTDGLAGAAPPAAEIASKRIELAITTVAMLLGALLLMLPVTWVYMSTKASNQGHNQQVAQTLIFLPIVVAGIVMVVQNSLALAFSLAGVVAAVRFRTTLRDSRDVVYVFLSIAVGFAAGIHNLIVAAIVSAVFNFVLIMTWRYDFGRNVLQPTAAGHWGEPLKELAATAGDSSVPDRVLMMSLDQKQAATLAERFERVQSLLGPRGKKPRYNGILSVSTEQLTEAQAIIEGVLEKMTRRWKLDEVDTNEGKPSGLYYLVRVRKDTVPDEIITEIRAQGGDRVINAELEIAPENKVKKNDKFSQPQPA